MKFNPFNSNTQQQGQSSGGGGIFSSLSNTNNTSSLFGNNINDKNPNSQGQGLFGNISNNNNSNTNNTSSSENKGPSLFGNSSNGNNTLFGAPKANNSSSGGLFGNLGSNAPNSAFGNFQNSNTNDSNKPKESNTFLFGAQNNNTNTQSVQNSQAEKNKEGNPFSLFNPTNNISPKTQEKPKENKAIDNQTKPGLFSNTISNTQTQSGINKPAGGLGLGLFGAPKEQEEKKKEITINTNNPLNQTQSQNQKKEDKKKNVLFGNNINNQSGITTGGLFGNTGNKNEQKKIENPNPSQVLNSINNTSNTNANNNVNQNAQNQSNINNNPQINNKEKKNYLNLKIPEKPFDFSFCNSKELEEYEKNQLMHKTSKEIIEDFKTTLLNQKAKYKQCVKNTREFERKLMGIIEITNANALMSEINEKNSEKIIQKINSINYQSKNLENILTNFNDKLGQTLAPYKDNVMNSDKILLNQNNSEKFKFYENFQQISDKCYNLENSINETEQNLAKKEEIMEEKIKDSKEGFWIERDKGKIFVNQHEINTLFNECYDGLYNLKIMQDNIDRKYEMLKTKLMKNIGNNNNININNNYNYNININNTY